MKDNELIHELSPRTYKSRYKMEIKQQYIKLNTGAKEIQQLNPGGYKAHLHINTIHTGTCQNRRDKELSLTILNFEAAKIILS